MYSKGVHKEIFSGIPKGLRGKKSCEIFGKTSSKDHEEIASLQALTK